MSIPGFATAEMTRQLANITSAASPWLYRKLGRTNLYVSRFGFGTYRCNQDDPDHRIALTSALEGGCNVIDTAANYGDGDAEALIGDVLNEQVVWNGQPREGYVVVSKIGYVQGSNLVLAQNRIAEGEPFKEMVKYADGLWHCIHPQFLEDQLTRMLARMHLDTLDVLLLHNPEYFLMAGPQPGIASIETLQDQFYHRIRRAFIQMEKFAADGLIRWYGISSNVFAGSPNKDIHLSLNRVWDCYRDACLQFGKSPEDGHFGVIQLPLNLLEHDAFTRSDTSAAGRDQSLLEKAKSYNLGVLTNRPLNAIEGNMLVRLAGDPQQGPAARVAQLLSEIQAFQSTELSLAQKSLLATASIPGVDVVLNGMRRSDYVKQIVDLAEIRSLEAVEHLLKP